MSPKLKFWLTGLLVGAGAFIASLSADASWDGAAVRAAGALAVAQIIQYFSTMSEVGPGPAGVKPW